MCKLLERGDLALRIAAGETVALVYELARQSDVSLQGPVKKLDALLRDFARGSHKNKGKREKRKLKSSFRAFIKSVEVSVFVSIYICDVVVNMRTVLVKFLFFLLFFKDGCTPHETIKFGPDSIRMTSWTSLVSRLMYMCNPMRMRINMIGLN